MPAAPSRDWPRLPAADPAERALWEQACLAADLFARAAPAGRIGITVRAAAGPVRDAWMERLQSRLGDMPLLTVPAHIGEDRLLGGLDLTATLEQGRSIFEPGLLARADGCVLALTLDGSERRDLPHICAAFDDGSLRVERDGAAATVPARFALVVLDETEAGEAPMPPALSDRLALHVDLTPIGIRALGSERPRAVAAERTAVLPVELEEAVAQLPLGFGLTSLRVPLQLAQVARLHAENDGRSDVTPDDLEAAVRLSLLGRALALPSENEEPAPPEPEPHNQTEPQDEPRDEADQTDANLPPLDMVLDAIAASLPPGLLEHLQAQRALLTRRPEAGRAGQRRSAPTRGRPLASRRGKPVGSKRLDLLATIRAAAPWQKLRQREGDTRALKVRANDMHIRRYKEAAASSVIFAVDASGSTALNRLAEAKGAVELLLGDSYARRDHVGLIAFRGQAADLLLSPTRSLVRAKRALSALPGGGGTPLADAIRLASETALDESSRGRTPTVVLMTDGSANVALDGTGGRTRAKEEALAAATAFGTAGIAAIVLDVSRKPSANAQAIAAAMGATYVPMPAAGAQALGSTVRTALGASG